MAYSKPCSTRFVIFLMHNGRVTHLTESLKVSRIAADLAVRRRVLEQKFRTLLGRSVLAEIHRARVERVKELLASTEQPMSEVAKQSGFSSPQRMAIVFRKLTGRSPGEYRREVRRRLS